MREGLEMSWIRGHLEAIAGPGLVMLMLLTLLFF